MPAEEENQSSLKEGADVPPEQAQPVVLRQEPEKDLVTWTAPSRPFKRKDRQFYITLIAIAFIVCLVLFFVEGAMPVILIVSLIFLYYIMNTVEPGETEYKITTKGIKVAGKRTEWSVMTRFWFSSRFGSGLLVFETLVLPGRLELVIKDEIKEEIKKAVAIYLPEEEVPPSVLDKAVGWFANKMPGNK